MLKWRWPILLVALLVAFLFSLTIHYVTASNSVESRVEDILATHNEIIRLQEKKRWLCDWLGTYWDVRLEGICVLPYVDSDEEVQP